MSARIRQFLFALALTTTMLPAGAFAQHDEHAEHIDEGDHHAGLDEDGHGEHSEEDHAHGGGEVTLSKIFSDRQFLASLITFFVLFFLVVKLAGGKINEALGARKREIMENLEEAQRKKAEAEALREEYADRLSRMGEELERIKAEMLKAGEAERDRIVADAEHKAASMRRETQFQIEQKFKQLREDLTREAVAAAIGAAQERVASEATMSDQTRLAEDYLKNIAEAAGAEVQA